MQKVALMDTINISYLKGYIVYPFNHDILIYDFHNFRKK